MILVVIIIIISALTTEIIIIRITEVVTKTTITITIMTYKTNNMVKKEIFT